MREEPIIDIGLQLLYDNNTPMGVVPEHHVEWWGDLPSTTLGAYVGSNSIGTSDAVVGVHWWYDIGSQVRFRVSYRVDRQGCRLVPAIPVT
jgi:hypothetical protein